MGLNLLRKLAAEFHKSSFMIVMADETRDASNTEQVVLVIRRVTGCFEVHEEFVGMYQVPCTDAETLTAIISDVFTRMNLTFKKLRGRCYDGARAMSGIKSGVAERIRKIEPRAIFTHCYGHSLSLAASDMVKQVKLLKDSLGVTHEITKLIKYSPRREEIFQRLKENLSSYSKTGIRILSLTRWTVGADSLASIIDNYVVLLSTWQESLEIVHDTTMKARIHGVQAQVKTFQFFYGAVLGEKLLRHTDNLSKTLQHNQISAAEGQQLAQMTVRTLKTLCSEQAYDLFWFEVNKKAENLNIPEPELPHQRKRPPRLEEGATEPFFTVMSSLTTCKYTTRPLM